MVEERAPASVSKPPDQGAERSSPHLRISCRNCRCRHLKLVHGHHRHPHSFRGDRPCPDRPHLRAPVRGRTTPPRRPVGTAAPLPRRVPGRLGRRPRPLHRWCTPGRSRCTTGRGVRAGLSRRSPGHHPRSRQAAARRRPRAHLPTPPPLDLVERGAVPVWRARAISRETHDLSVEAVAFADRLICATPSKIGLVDAARLVQEARLYFDPDRAIADEEHELARRGVWLRHRGNPATTDVVMTLDTPDALLVRPDRHPHRRRARPPRRHRPGRRPPSTGGRDPRRPPVRPGPHVGSRRSPHRGCWCAVNLFVHLDPDQPGAVSIEKLGAATEQLLADWLSRHAAPAARSSSDPSSTSAQSNAVDQHDPPTAMRELCLLRDAHCVFPGCRTRLPRLRPRPHHRLHPHRPTADHPARRTHSISAPLCRTHHRIKTFTAWDYKRLDDGTYVWTSPTGHQYEVAPGQPPPTTKNLTPPPPRPAPAGATPMP